MARSRVDAIVPPPLRPNPAVIDTPLCATCSSATKSLKSSCLYNEYNSPESMAKSRVAAIVPPPFNPVPAVIETEV